MEFACSAYTGKPTVGQPTLDPADMIRTELCKFAQMGQCKKGNNCRFAHGKAQLQTRPDLYRTKLCNDFQKKGACKMGDDCKFAHGYAHLRRTTEDARTSRSRMKEEPKKKMSELYDAVRDAVAYPPQTLLAAQNSMMMLDGTQHEPSHMYSYEYDDYLRCRSQGSLSKEATANGKQLSGLDGLPWKFEGLPSGPSTEVLSASDTPEEWSTDEDDTTSSPRTPSSQLTADDNEDVEGARAQTFLSKLVEVVEYSTNAVLIANLPSEVTSKDMILELQHNGIIAPRDFNLIYLPMSQFMKNKGYCVINTQNTYTRNVLVSLFQKYTHAAKPFMAPPGLATTFNGKQDNSKAHSQQAVDVVGGIFWVPEKPSTAEVTPKMFSTTPICAPTREYNEASLQAFGLKTYDMTKSLPTAEEALGADLAWIIGRASI